MFDRPDRKILKSHNFAMRFIRKSDDVIRRVFFIFLIGSVTAGLFTVVISWSISEMRALGLERSVMFLSITGISFWLLRLVRKQIFRLIEFCFLLLFRLIGYGLKFIYYCLMLAFYISFGLFWLSVGSSGLQGLFSFLTAPIGIKADAQVEGLGSLYLPLAAGAAASGVAFWIATMIKREYESNEITEPILETHE